MDDGEGCMRAYREGSSSAGRNAAHGRAGADLVVLAYVEKVFLLDACVLQDCLLFQAVDLHAVLALLGNDFCPPV